MSEIRLTHSSSDKTMSFTATEHPDLVLSLFDADARAYQSVTLTAWQARQLLTLLQDAILDGEGYGPTHGRVHHLREMCQRETS